MASDSLDGVCQLRRPSLALLIMDTTIPEVMGIMVLIPKSEDATLSGESIIGHA